MARIHLEIAANAVALDLPSAALARAGSIDTMLTLTTSQTAVATVCRIE